MSNATATASWSLRRRLATGLVLTALLPVLLFGAAFLVSQWQRNYDDLMLRLDANARLNANVIDDFLEAQLAGVRLLAERASDDPAIRNEELSRLLDVYPSMLRAMWVDADGNVVLVRDTRGRALLPITGLVADEAWFAAAKARHLPYVSDVYRRSAYGNDVVVGVSMPVLRDGEFHGALQAEIPVQSFARLSADSMARRGLELLLLDRDGRVAYATQRLRWQVLEQSGADGDALRRAALGPDRNGRIALRPGLLRDGDNAYVEAVSMRNGWTLVLVTAQRQLLAPLLSRGVLLVILLAATMLGVLWALWRQRQLLRRSMGYLLASLRGYALGGTLDPAQAQALPEELQPLAAGIGDLGARMNAAFGELKQVLDERDNEIAARTESLRHAVAELDRLSRTDAMTGSLNYRGFTETGERLWRLAKSTGTSLAVLALDIDHFKRYNDLYGHAEGDNALRRFAGAVRSALLHADDVLARPGGEEFLVFLPSATFDQAMHVGQRVCQRVRDADIVHAGSGKGRLTVSVGVAALEPGDGEIEDLLKRADAALYRAKAAGRDGVSD